MQKNRTDCTLSDFGLTAIFFSAVLLWSVVLLLYPLPTLLLFILVTNSSIMHPSVSVVSVRFSFSFSPLPPFFFSPCRTRSVLSSRLFSSTSFPRPSSLLTSPSSESSSSFPSSPSSSIDAGNKKLSNRRSGGRARKQIIRDVNRWIKNQEINARTEKKLIAQKKNEEKAEKKALRPPPLKHRLTLDWLKHFIEFLDCNDLKKTEIERLEKYYYQYGREGFIEQIFRRALLWLPQDEARWREAGANIPDLQQGKFETLLPLAENCISGAFFLLYVMIQEVRIAHPAGPRIDSGPLFVPEYYPQLLDRIKAQKFNPAATIPIISELRYDGKCALRIDNVCVGLDKISFARMILVQKINNKSKNQNEQQSNDKNNDNDNNDNDNDNEPSNYKVIVQILHLFNGLITPSMRMETRQKLLSKLRSSVCVCARCLDHVKAEYRRWKNKQKSIKKLQNME